MKQRIYSLTLTLFLLMVAAEVISGPDVKPDDGGAVFINPILPGGYPDPSICRLGDDFYIVNSTFEYFPGLPIHHSKDLINWELIGYGLHREEQVTRAVNLVDVQSDGGIHAPTLRCHEGKFYIITTNVYVPPGTDRTEFVNFVITADDPRGPWSEPHVLEGAPGIDPDIFFDDDGKVWYVGTHNPENPNFDGEGEIWLQEIDTSNWSLVGERHYLWRGACGGIWVEGPHLYKKDGRYYLLVAEGGTSFNHAVMMAMSDDITGPYRSNPRNPIMTSRHLSYDNWVHSTGHADLVELEDGRWYMVLLGIRGDEKRASNMGRETHLVPVTWEREPFWWKEDKTLWPLAAPKTGKVERYSSVPFSGTKQYRDLSFADSFDSAELKLDWNFRRLPEANTYSLTANQGFLRLYAKANVIQERKRASLVGFRQTASDFEYTAKMHFAPESNDSEAGIIVYQKDNNYISLTLQKSESGLSLKAVHSAVADDSRIIKAVNTLNEVGIEQPEEAIYLRILSKDHQYQLLYSLDGTDNFELLTTTTADGVLSRKYTGANLGLYSTGNGMDSGDYADFDWVEYQGFERQPF